VVVLSSINVVLIIGILHPCNIISHCASLQINSFLMNNGKTENLQIDHYPIDHLKINPRLTTSSSTTSRLIVCRLTTSSSATSRSTTSRSSTSRSTTSRSTPSRSTASISNTSRLIASILATPYCTPSDPLPPDQSSAAPLPPRTHPISLYHSTKVHVHVPKMSDSKWNSKPAWLQAPLSHIHGHQGHLWSCLITVSKSIATHQIWKLPVEWKHQAHTE